MPRPFEIDSMFRSLTTLPGVVAIGDRGGQLFVRGGEPSHNMALIDGMVQQWDGTWRMNNKR